MSPSLLTLSPEQLREPLHACLAVPRWIDAVAAHAPYASTADLLDVARDAALSLTRSEVDEAMQEHPRIGEVPVAAPEQAQRFSRAEQNSADAGDETLAVAMLEGNRAYEERFGRVFLIRAAGRTRAQILEELHRRLGLSDEEEAVIVAHELRDIALLRLEALAGRAE
ncbi:2-oxo-4-hydroxy-4-carboxy-5-ureidoimidazoline decarboxylase [Cryobacterium melibiosiphilum]|uniref:2-oxo-4-hydroxy-4-carboxy-5-ureidoimidazoline decarboxylase n=1 Tax=Cryobacterium melibiosiphilum TaxID=995039 RepID=A0A3A5MDM2_9MICO|nr:2-oxo-4-hydroxy-4-carboxy-5-ureidoimidazoline decarboxylase [Cryobacterium melibiosiphilum]RJT88217.1 2-oxo-4-hydroxy-4-carboxy-5-ureidoimidazoline decarboxylase [Cryobacterium melibiosiphilum]